LVTGFGRCRGRLLSLRKSCWAPGDMALHELGLLADGVGKFVALGLVLPNYSSSAMIRDVARTCHRGWDMSTCSIVVFAASTLCSMSRSASFSTSSTAWSVAVPFSAGIDKRRGERH